MLLVDLEMKEPVIFVKEWKETLLYCPSACVIVTQELRVVISWAKCWLKQLSGKNTGQNISQIRILCNIAIKEKYRAKQQSVTYWTKQQKSSHKIIFKQNLNFSLKGNLLFVESCIWMATILSVRDLSVSLKCVLSKLSTSPQCELRRLPENSKKRLKKLREVCNVASDWIKCILTE